MKLRLLFVSALLTFSLPALSIDASKGYETGSVVLYQPNEVLQTRVGNVSDLANYIKHLQSVCAEFYATATTPETLHVVVAVRPGKRSRVWFVSTRSTPDAQRDPLRKKLESVSPCKVSTGPIAFAITAKLAGGDSKDSKSDREFKPPMPKEWQNAKTGTTNVIIPDGILDVIWPDKQ